MEKNKQNHDIKIGYQNLVKAQALTHIGSWEADLINNKHYWSEEAYRIYGITEDQYDKTYSGFLEFVHPDDVELIENILKDPPRLDIFDMEFRIIQRDGSIRNLYQIMEMERDREGRLVKIHGTIQDITERKELEKKLEDNELIISRLQEQNRLYQQESNDFFETVNREGIIQFISNPTAISRNGDDRNPVGCYWLDFVDQTMRYRLKEAFDSILDKPGQKVKETINYTNRFGKKVIYELSIRNLFEDATVQAMGIYWYDITDRVELEHKMAFMATHDELTQLPNKIYLKKRLDYLCCHFFGKGLKLALMILEIKEYQNIKEMLGYQIADVLNLMITKRLKEHLKNQYFFGRIAEDQYAIIVSAYEDQTALEKFALEIQQLFSTGIKADQYDLHVATYAGISVYEQDAQDGNHMFDHAVKALSQAKSTGRNSYRIHSQEMNIKSYKEFQMRNDLFTAIEKEQFRIYYQPIVNLQTSDILAVEALIRWEHPTWGQVMPQDFIPIAEETGYIRELGKWMLKEACKNYKQWMAEGLPKVKVSMNYSKVQFFENRFVENMMRTLRQYDIESKTFIIEITEQILVNEMDQVIQNVNRLRDLGFHIALDDFGAEHSTMLNLYQLKADIIKINQSFIRKIPKDEICTVITKYIIDMARELRIQLVAVGIENWDQLLLLRKLNCHTGQGYLYSKPIPADEIKKLLVKKNCKPLVVNHAETLPFQERRNYFRIQFPELLEAVLSIVEISGKKVGISNTNVLIKNIGPGGLCFISNILFPVRRDIILQFTATLLGKRLRVYGCPVWSGDLDANLYEYGIEFTFDENDRKLLTRLLHQVQIKMKNSRGFKEGSFIKVSMIRYFYGENGSSWDLNR